MDTTISDTSTEVTWSTPTANLSNSLVQIFFKKTQLHGKGEAKTIDKKWDEGKGVVWERDTAQKAPLFTFPPQPIPVYSFTSLLSTSIDCVVSRDLR